MTHQSAAPALLTAADIAATDETRFAHPFNAQAVRLTKSLGDLTGLTTMGVHLVRVEPGQETTAYHTHACSDEFLYILAGQGTAEIDGHTFPVGPGDFMGFPQGGPAHTMHNTGAQDLVYLVGGTRPVTDIVTYPRLGRKMIKHNGASEFAALDDLHPLR